MKDPDRGELPGAGHAESVPGLVWIVLALVAALAMYWRFDAGLVRDLWEDEVIAAAHSEHPLWRLPVAVLRYDVHPFLYFAQLHVWSLAADSDLWLRLNSMFWNILAIVSVFVVGRRLYGLPAGLIAAALFAVAAPSVWMAQEVRPYSWMYCLLIWGFWSAERFATAQGGARSTAGLAVTSLAIVYSHALGSLAVFLLGLYTLIRLLEERAPRRRLVVWLMLFGAVAVAGLLPLAVAMSRDANLGMPDELLTGNLRWVQRLLMPRGYNEAALTLSGLVFATVAVGGLVVRPTRPMAGILLLLPLVLAAGLAAAGHMVFKLNVFSTMILPFFCLVAGRLLAALAPAPRWAGAALMGAALITFTVMYQQNRVQTTGYQVVSDLLSLAVRPGDVVYVPQPGMFWGLARYLGTDRRGWQLEIAGPPNEQWRRMYDRLGPTIVGFFGLEPRGQKLATLAGPVLLTGSESIAQAAGAGRVWVVTYPSRNLPADFPPLSINGLPMRGLRQVQQLEVRLYAPDR